MSFSVPPVAKIEPLFSKDGVQLVPVEYNGETSLAYLENAIRYGIELRKRSNDEIEKIRKKRKKWTSHT